MGKTSETHDLPLLQAQTADSSFKRTGNLWTAVAHIITAVIGSGALSLAWSTAQLGWIAGPLAVLSFAAITLVSSFLLSNCYRTPDPEHGPGRNRSYIEAVDLSLGEKRGWICGFFVQISLFGTAIAYTVTSAISMRAIKKSNCYHKEGHEAACEYSDTSYMLMFGFAQIILSQTRNLNNVEWLSVFAAIMSFTYSFIGLGLGLATVIENGYAKGSISGVSASSSIQKLSLVSQGLGDIAFAFPFVLILIEVQDTLKSPPPESHTMKKASTIAIFVTTIFYLLCGCFGYAAFGDDTPGNLLTGFGFYEPYWLVDLANACIVAHLVGGYQVYSQPLFATTEKWISGKFPNLGFLYKDFHLNVPLIPGFRLSLLRLCFRTIYVLSTTAIAMVFPYFNQVIGVIGGLNFWPLSIYFPVEMYFKQKNIEPWTRTWVMLRIFSLFCFIITLFALIGSIEGLIGAKLS